MGGGKDPVAFSLAAHTTCNGGIRRRRVRSEEGASIKRTYCMIPQKNQSFTRQAGKMFSGLSLFPEDE